MDLMITALKSHLHTMQQLEPLAPLAQSIAERMIQAIRTGGKILWMGNGGSAADAQHLAAELIGRFKCERPAIASIALTTDSSVLTCLSNDYDFSIIFQRQIEALCKPQDVVIGISTSGNSENVLKGIQAAKKIGAYTVAFTGNRGKLASISDACLAVPSDNTARIQEAHIFLGHCICEYIELAVSKIQIHQQTESIT